MIENKVDYVDDMTNRYIAQVMKHLSNKNSSDIEAELRSLISDILEEQTKGKVPSRQDVNFSLNKLGSPYKLAAKYSDKNSGLIGPAIYPTYLTVLRIVLSASLLAMFISIISNISSASNILWYEFAGDWLTHLLNELFGVFFAVTIIFAIIERKYEGIQNNPKKEWNPSTLPPVPTRKLSVPIKEPIIGIAIKVTLMILLIFSPQVFGLYFSGGSRVIPLFNLDEFYKVLPLLLICFGLGFAKSTWKLIERKISKQYAVFQVITNIIIVFFLTIVFTKFNIFNINFMIEINRAFHVEHNITDGFQAITKQGTVSFFVTLYLIQSAFTTYKVIRY